ncbi:hypothetical protein J6590_013825 [Homalodisca vitripennis]|nr:hypothetical protein J6590_013825 [Homalodisca vitripennis]
MVAQLTESANRHRWLNQQDKNGSRLNSLSADDPDNSIILHRSSSLQSSDVAVEFFLHRFCRDKVQLLQIVQEGGGAIVRPIVIGERVLAFPLFQANSEADADLGAAWPAEQHPSYPDPVGDNALTIGP